MTKRYERKTPNHFRKNATLETPRGLHRPSVIKCYHVPCVIRNGLVRPFPFQLKNLISNVDEDTSL